MSKLITSRRTLLKGSAAAAAGLATPTIFTSQAWAAGYTNEPTGADVTLGFNVPQTGAYADEGADELRAYELAVPSFTCPTTPLALRYTITGHFDGLFRMSFTGRDCQVVDDPCAADIDYNFVDAEFAMSSTDIIASAGVVTMDERRGVLLQNYTQILYPSLIYNRAADNIALDIGPYFLAPEDPFGAPINDETAQALKAFGPLQRVPVSECGL